MATQLRPFLTEIANAIRTKKGTSGVINAQNFASEIASIPSGGGENPLQALVSGKGADGGYYLCQNYKGDNVDFLNGIDFSATTNMQNMFKGCNNITTIPLINTSSATKMSYMFDSCSNLISVPNLDTSSATDMGYMFRNCNNLKNVPEMNTSNVTGMAAMFEHCHEIISIKLNTDKATQPPSFGYCYKLTTIELSYLGKINSSFYASNLFSKCYSLTKIIIRTMDVVPLYNNPFLDTYHFTGTISSTYNPEGLKDGRMYVPDEMVEEMRAATGWADFAECIVPLSTLVE